MRPSSATVARRPFGISPPLVSSGTAPSTSHSASSPHKFATAQERSLPRRTHGDQGRPGTLAAPRAESGVDVYAWPHNETSTGVMAPVCRCRAPTRTLVLVDATSGAGGIPVDITRRRLLLRPAEVLRLRRRPLAALFSPPPRARVEEIAASGRWVPTSSACRRRSTPRARTRPTTRPPWLPSR